MGLVDNLTVSDRIKKIIETSSNSFAENSHHRNSFQEATKELSSQIDCHGIDGLHSDVSSAFTDFLDKLNIFLEDVNRRSSSLYHDDW